MPHRQHSYLDSRKRWLFLYEHNTAGSHSVVNCSTACLCHLIISDEISNLKCIFTEQHPTLLQRVPSAAG